MVRIIPFVFSAAVCALLCSCFSIGLQSQDPRGGSASEAAEKPRAFQFIPRADCGTSCDWFEASPDPARWQKVEFRPHSLLRHGGLLLIAGGVRQAPFTARTLILSSKDGGKTWREENVLVAAADVVDLRAKGDSLSGLVFSANGDGFFEGYVVNRGAWKFIAAPKEFDPQKTLGFGSYYHLGHEPGAYVHVFLEGADKAAEYRLDPSLGTISFVRRLTKEQTEARRKALPPLEAEAEWERLFPSPPSFWMDRRSGQLSDIPL